MIEPKKPTLIKQGNNYLIYGCSNTLEWKTTRLDSSIVSKLDLNFGSNKGFDLTYKQIEPRLGDLYVMELDHALTRNIVNQYLWDPRKKQLHYLELRRCDLHFMPYFPDYTFQEMKAKYKHRYLLIAEQELIYIDADGFYNHVEIDSLEHLLSCNPKKANHISLSKKQFEYYITENGGHKRQGVATTQGPIELIDKRKIKAFVATGLDFYKLTNEQCLSLFVENARFPITSKLNLRSPTLTKYGERYFIYGYHPLSAWKYTVLEAAVVSRYGLSDRETIHIDGQNQYKALYAHIMEKAGHYVKRHIKIKKKFCIKQN